MMPLSIMKTLPWVVIIMDGIQPTRNQPDNFTTV